MFKKILTTSVLVTFLASTALAQVETMSAPGKSLPIASESSEEGIPLLNSAPVAPSASITVSDIAVDPDAHEAVFSFSTSISTHVVIEYGLTPDYERSISTEPQTDHTETIGELTECTTYYYRVHIGDVSREGDFKTLCPKIVVQNTKYKVQNTVKKQKAVPVVSVAPVVEPIVAEPAVVETIPVLNAAPEEQLEIEQKQKEGSIRSETQIDEVTPETPALPGPIAFGDDTNASQSSQNTTPVVLILFALLSGMIVTFFAFKKKKKWYQK